MSEKTTLNTKKVSIRELTDQDKQRIRGLLRYGDIGRIATKCPHVSYDTVAKTFNEKHSVDHERVWLTALEYLNGLPGVEVDARLESFIKKGVAA